jgi:hypothetical protein
VNTVRTARQRTAALLFAVALSSADAVEPSLADEREITMRIEEKAAAGIQPTMLRLAPDGSASLALGTLPVCARTDAGVFDFDGLHVQFKARAISRRRNPQDVSFTLDRGGGIVQYFEDRELVEELLAKARNSITSRKPGRLCPLFPPP